MKYIIVSDYLPVGIGLSEGNADNIIKDYLLNPTIQKPQKYKASVSKILFGKIKIENKEESIHFFDAPNFMQPIYLRKDVIENSVFIGLPFLYTNEISAKIDDTAIQKINMHFKDVNLYPILPKPGDFGLSNNYAKTRMNNIFNCSSWTDIYIKNKDEPSYKDYKNINKIYCEKVKQVYEDGDIVIVVSHLAWLLPKLLRKCILKPFVIGICLQTPFPNLEMFKGLYQPLDLLDSILESNFINVNGVQDMRNFISVCKFYKSISFINNLNENGTHVKIQFQNKNIEVNVSKLGNNPESTRVLLKNNNLATRISDLKKKYGNKKIIVSVSGTSNAATHTNALLAYGNYLRKYGNDSVLVLVELGGSELKDFEGMHENQRIIESFMLFYSDEKPEIEYYRPVNETDYLSIFSAADIVLFLDERDVIGKSVLDYLICHEENSNLLIISRFAHISENFPEEVKVNPKDSVILSEKMKYLFNLEHALKLKIKGDILDQTTDRTAKKYFLNLSNDLKNITPEKIESKSKKDISEIVEKYKKSKKRLFLLDYDGTLCSISENPEDAKPTKYILDLVSNLAKKQENKVFIVTGRGYKELDEWFPDRSIELSAEHGHCLRNQDGKWHIKSENTEWKSIGKEVMDFFADRTPGSFVESKETSLTFHYIRSDKRIVHNQVLSLKSALIKMFSRNKNVSFVDGKNILELRSNLNNKGTVCQSIISQNQYDFVFSAGDDKTDEDMFRIGLDNQNFYSVVVGDKLSNAKYKVNGVNEFCLFLEELSGIKK